ncbi:AbrB/MazE/SpoVT family DNA-binding domain-containing protein [Halosimplex salinum]|uniref:AbrB/MazE/SpoVT family DNA-binding domain-containing protein n=1 Tax=Halosimplex salinum TaxID=1710538 RepID=UPI000F47A47F|nr:AbrB/MazE/SpoVT family DNA-binding domain-containing protein [Halosimplex salinum]
MSKSTDERGRLYLPKDVRDRFGDRYRIVELPTHVALFPVDDDPLSGLREAVGDAFEGDDIGSLKSEARASIARTAEEEADERGPSEE